MSRVILRTAACCALVGLASMGSVQAQSAPAATGSLPDFTGIVQQNAPAVVHVEAKYSGKRNPRKMPRTGQQQTPDDGDGNDPDDLLRRFFGMPMMPSPEEQARTSLGSGFIISHDGYIITNTHVVDDADTVTVRLQDRRTLTAKVVGSDPQYDIALLKVDAGSNLPAVSIGDSRALKPGQWVLAIGSPFGFDYTVTQGIVSAIGRNLGNQDQPYTSFIQTDVPINRGNSGGPLFNLQGQVVGVNSQIYSNTGGYLGVAFSIPIDVAMNAVKQIKEHGFVSRGMLGVTVQPLTDEAVKALKLPDANGALVGDVTAGSGAEKAGIHAGDVVLAFNGQRINQASDLPPLVGITPPGTKATLQVLRDGKKMDVPVTVGELPRDKNALASSSGKGSQPGERAGSSLLGLTVQDIDADTRKQLGLKAGEGVVVANVTGRVAAQAGLRSGDVILRVNQMPVSSAASFREATKGVKAGSTVLLLVRRDDRSQFIGLTVPGSDDSE
ncbi:MAG TPA: DegQ family serine endoprotease [Dyella sp.]|uniref:DegQ family serine endoprotease n=1 Tax=Dyella sp. TaxID=1869338 RepID=UPI002F956E64